MEYIDIVFDHMPDGGPDGAASFIEVEAPNGASINFGEWVTREDGYAVLRITAVDWERRRQMEKGYTAEHDDSQGIGHLIHEAGMRVAAKPEHEVTYEDLIQGAALLKAAADVRNRQLHS